MARKSLYILIYLAEFFYLLSLVIFKNADFIRIIILMILYSCTFFVASSKASKQIDKAVLLAFPVMLTITSSIKLFDPEAARVASAPVGVWQLSNLFFFYMLIRSHQNVDILKQNKLVVVFFASALVSLFTCTSIEYAVAGLKLFGYCLILFLWYGTVVKNRIQERLVVNGFEIAGLFQSFIAILQSIRGGAIGLSALGEVDSAFRTRFVDGEIQTGTAGTFAHSGRLAIFLLFCILIVLLCEKKTLRKAFCAIVIFIGIWSASSRMAIVGLVVALVYLAFRERRELLKPRNMVLVIGTVASVIAIIAYMYSSGRLDIFFKSDIDLQAFNRITHWRIAFEGIIKRPIWGYGINNYSSYMTTIGQMFMYTNPVHNVFLLYWFELGLLGGVTYILVLIKNSIMLRRIRNSHPLVKCAMIYVVAVIVYNFTGWSFSCAPGIFLLWISIGLINNQHLSIQHEHGGESSYG